MKPVKKKTQKRLAKDFRKLITKHGTDAVTTLVNGTLAAATMRAEADPVKVKTTSGIVLSTAQPE